MQMHLEIIKLVKCQKLPAKVKIQAVNFISCSGKSLLFYRLTNAGLIFMVLVSLLPLLGEFGLYEKFRALVFFLIFMILLLCVNSRLRRVKDAKIIVEVMSRLRSAMDVGVEAEGAVIAKESNAKD